MSALGFESGGSYSSAAAISTDGTAVVGYGDDAGGHLEAFKWTVATGMLGLGLAYGKFQTFANDASGNASLNVGDYFYDGASGIQEYEGAYIYSSEYGYADLPDYLQNSLHLSSALSGWTDIDARDISADGTTIVGDGVDPNGNHAYWEATDSDAFGQPYSESYSLSATLAQYGSSGAAP